MTSSMLFLCAAFVMGLLFGSFLNVCISRLPAHESLWHPRSHCRSCGKTIAWYDNIPVLSWLLLHGKCRACGERISWRYPAVELALGIWFAVVVVAWFPLTMRGLYTQPSTGTEIATSASAMAIAVLGFFLIGL